MKVLSVINEQLFVRLKCSGILGDNLPYQDVSESIPDGDLYDAIVVDISLEDTDGTYTPRVLISNGHTLPIIGLFDELNVSNEQEFEKEQASFISQGGLYLLKTSVTVDLLKACIAQAAAVSKFKTTQCEPIKVFRDGKNELRVNLISQMVTVNENEIGLTSKEYFIVDLLARRANSVVSKEALLRHLYNGLDEPEIKIVDVFICKIRKKLGVVGDFIQTSWGQGYILREVTKVKSVA